MLRVPERHEINAHGFHDWHREQKHHGGAMHGEELVVEIRPDQRAVRPRKLQTHQRGDDAAGDEEAECGDEIPARDALVIHRFQPAEKTRLVAPCARQLCVLVWRDQAVRFSRRAHLRASR
jgi:hypothetical protein